MLSCDCLKYYIYCLGIQTVAARLPHGSEALSLVHLMGYAWATDAISGDQDSMEARRLVLPEAQFSSLRPVLQAVKALVQQQRVDLVKLHQLHGQDKLRPCIALYLNFAAQRNRDIKVGCQLDSIQNRKSMKFENSSIFSSFLSTGNLCHPGSTRLGVPTKSISTR